MSDVSDTSGRGKFTPVPFTYTYSVNGCDPVEKTWQGRGRKPSDLLVQIEWEKEQSEDGVSSTEVACDNRDPRKAEAEAKKARLEKIRAERKAARDAEAAERAQRRAERQAKKEARIAAEAAAKEQDTAAVA